MGLLRCIWAGWEEDFHVKRKRSSVMRKSPRDECRLLEDISWSVCLRVTSLRSPRLTLFIRFMTIFCGGGSPHARWLDCR